MQIGQMKCEFVFFGAYVGGTNDANLSFEMVNEGAWLGYYRHTCCACRVQFLLPCKFVLLLRCMGKLFIFIRNMLQSLQLCLLELCVRFSARVLGESLLRSVPPYVSLQKSLPDSDWSVLSFLNHWQLQCSKASTDVKFVLVHPRFGNILVDFFIYWVHGSLGLIGWASLYIGP